MAKYHWDSLVSQYTFVKHTCGTTDKKKFAKSLGKVRQRWISVTSGCLLPCSHRLAWHKMGLHGLVVRKIVWGPDPCVKFQVSFTYLLGFLLGKLSVLPSKQAHFSLGELYLNTFVKKVLCSFTCSGVCSDHLFSCLKCTCRCLTRAVINASFDKLMFNNASSKTALLQTEQWCVYKVSLVGCLHSVSQYNPWPLPPSSPRRADFQPRPCGGWCPLPDSPSLRGGGDFFFLLQEMVSDLEQCVNSPVTLDKPAGRPVTGTYGMFDRERGCELHWMIKCCFSPFGNVMLSGKRVDHRSLKRLTPASLWHLLQGPGFFCLAPGHFWRSEL